MEGLVDSVQFVFTSKLELIGSITDSDKKLLSSKVVREFNGAIVNIDTIKSYPKCLDVDYSLIDKILATGINIFGKEKNQVLSINVLISFKKKVEDALSRCFTVAVCGLKDEMLYSEYKSGLDISFNTDKNAKVIFGFYDGKLKDKSVRGFSCDNLSEMLGMTTNIGEFDKPEIESSMEVKERTMIKSDEIDKKLDDIEVDDKLEDKGADESEIKEVKDSDDGSDVEDSHNETNDSDLEESDSDSEEPGNDYGEDYSEDSGSDIEDSDIDDSQLFDTDDFFDTSVPSLQDSVDEIGKTLKNVEATINDTLESLKDYIEEPESEDDDTGDSDEASEPVEEGDEAEDEDSESVDDDRKSKDDGEDVESGTHFASSKDLEEYSFGGKLREFIKSYGGPVESVNIGDVINDGDSGKVTFQLEVNSLPPIDVEFDKDGGKSSAWFGVDGVPKYWEQIREDVLDFSDREFKPIITDYESYDSIEDALSSISGPYSLEPDTRHISR